VISRKYKSPFVSHMAPCVEDKYSVLWNDGMAHSISDYGLSGPVWFPVREACSVFMTFGQALQHI